MTQSDIKMMKDLSDYARQGIEKYKDHVGYGGNKVSSNFIEISVSLENPDEIKKFKACIFGCYYIGATGFDPLKRKITLLKDDEIARFCKECENVKITYDDLDEIFGEDREIMSRGVSAFPATDLSSLALRLNDFSKLNVLEICDIIDQIVHFYEK